jgi:hypothetical protein
MAACVTKGDFKALQEEVMRLKAANGPPLSVADQLKSVREDETALEKKYQDAQRTEQQRGDWAKVGQDKFDAALRLVEQKLRKDGGMPGPSSATFNCYKTICKGTSTHPTPAAYRAWVMAAFGPGPKQYHAWYSVTRVEGRDAGLVRNTTFYTGVPTESDLSQPDGGTAPLIELERGKGPLTHRDGGKGPSR